MLHLTPRYQRRPVLLVIAMCALTGSIASTCGAGPLSPSPLCGLRLPAPFTLKYTAVARIVNPLPGTPKGTDTRPRKFTVTLSAKDDKLLYKCEDATGSFAETVVYDGTKTYSDLSGRRSGGVQIAPGFSLDAMHYAPVPAVGFPGVSLLTLAIPGGAVEANRGLFDNCDKYVSRSIWGGAGMTRDYGSIELSTKNSPDPDYGIGCVGSVAESGTRKVLWYYCLNPGAPAFIWEYRKHVLFEGLWLATDIQARFYPRSASAANSTASPLFEIRDYRLVSASPIALPASAFVVADYVPSPSAATDLTGKTAKTFIFLPGRGTPEQQEARQDVIRADRRPVGPPILPRPKATPP